MEIILQSNSDVLNANDTVYMVKSFDIFDKVIFKDIKNY